MTGDGTDDFKQSADAFLLSDERGGARPVGFSPSSAVVVHRKDYDVGSGDVGTELARRANAIEARHADIHHHDIRVQHFGQLDRCCSFFCFAYDIEIGFTRHTHAEALAHSRLVIDKQQSDR